MSQRKEKYARNMERRTGALEDQAEKTEKRLDSYGVRLFQIEIELDNTRAMQRIVKEADHA